jgi:large subunit ribosomal protein L16
MVFSFSGLINRKFKKINGKVRFVGVRNLPKNLYYGKTSVLVSCGYGLISASEIEAVRRSIRKNIGKSKRVKLLTRIYPYIPLTGKPSEVRMGRGKGSKIRKWVYFCKPGKILFELKNLSSKRASIALNKASEKLAVVTKILNVFKLKSNKYDI